MVPGEKELSALLKRLSGLPGVRGSALLTRDGLPHEFAIPGAVNEDVFAAMGATLLGAAETALFELGENEADHVVVRSKHVALYITPANEDLVLVVALNDPGHIDQVMEEAKGILASE